MLSEARSVAQVTSHLAPNRAHWKPRHAIHAVAALALFAAIAPAVRAQQSSADLTSQSLEDLMNTQVTSVSKKEQKLSRTASAIFVISQEDIHRSGATNIPDLLRMVPGMDVAQINGSTWAISARGFNQQFSNKLLVTIDGRSVYTSTFAGVFWDTMDYPLEDIERIEVIRGPGGSVWGANAVDGVVNIITKKAGDTNGVLLVGGGGNVQQEFGLVQYGGKVNPETDYRIYTKYFDQAQMRDLTGQKGADDWHAFRTGFRLDSQVSAKDNLIFEGDLLAGREGEFGFFLPSITSPGLIAIPEEIATTDASFQTVWRHVFSPRSDTKFQASFNRHFRDDHLFPEVRDILDFDFQHHLAVGARHDFVWGLGYRFTPDHIEDSLTVGMNPDSRNLQVFTAFIQDEFAWVPDRFYLTVGTKLEHNDYTGFEIMPTIRGTWTPSTRQMFWAAISRGLRAPSRNDTDLLVNIGSTIAPGGAITLTRFVGNPNFKDERLIAYEAGYRSMISDRLSFDLAAFYNDYDQVQTTEPSASFFENAPPPPHQAQLLTYKNLIHGETHGAELSANWKVTNRWTISPGYALVLIHMQPEFPSVDNVTAPFIEHGSPRQSAQLRTHYEFGRGWEWNAAAYFVDRLTHQGPTFDQAIPAYTRLDTGLTWKFREGLSLGIVGQNLLRDRHLEFEDVFGAMQSGQMRRSAYAKFTWKF
jgi:iron complex outermembrane receptor protein